ncbi:MAG TPA: NADH-quinone oxidoreductase subunit A [Acidimicrobiales bacterium]|nr:NADH-quinone oxidoreductase subunit A [Acidimicrobiales bacterium]
MAAFGAALTVVVAGAVAVLVTRWLRLALGPGALTPPEQAPFLGGGSVETHAWSRYHVRYYAMALLFLAFDMEMVFMYPWAVVFVEEGVIALMEMLMFITILVLGILYAWRERALGWA